MVMTVSNIRRISKSSEVEGGGIAVAAVGLTDASIIVSPVVEGGGEGATPKDSTLGHLKLALI